MTTPRTDDVRSRIRRFLAENLSEPVADGQDIFAAGLANSLFEMQLVSFVEQDFGITVETDELNGGFFRSTDAMTDFVMAKQSQAQE